MEKYKLTKNNKYKRLLCAGLAAVMLSSIPIIKSISKKNKDDYIDISTSYTTSVDDDTKKDDVISSTKVNKDVSINNNKKDYDSNYKKYENESSKQTTTNNLKYVDDSSKSYENNNSTIKNDDENIIDLDNVIDDINNVLIDFNENSIYSSIYSQKKALENNNSDVKETLKGINNYSWGINGKIDKEKLVYKLTTNIKNSGGEINTDMLNITNAMSDAIIDDYNIIKKKNPEYNFKDAYKLIDNLIIEIDSNLSTDMLGCYSPKYKNIKINPKILKDKELMKKVLRHEVAHLYQDEVTSIKYQTLGYNFLNERFADSNAMESMGLGISKDYQSEEEKLIKLCQSTGKNINYYDSAIMKHDMQRIIDSFEEECKASAEACLFELDVACGYGDDYNIEYRSNCYDAAMLKLYKNACIRFSKEYNKGNLTRDQYLFSINESKNNILDNCNWDYEHTNTRDSLILGMEEIGNICNSIVKLKKLN